MAALFRQMMVGSNQYSESMRAQVFVQGLRPNLALAIGLFMPGTLHKAIERAKVSELTLAQNLTMANPIPFINPVVSYLQQLINEDRFIKSNKSQIVRRTVRRTLQNAPTLKIPEERNMNEDRNRPTEDVSQRKKDSGKVEVLEVLETNKEENNDSVYKLKKIAPNIRKEISKITRPSRVIISKIAKFCPKQDSNQKTTLMYCDAQVKGHPILLIVDSRVNGEQKQPLGEIDEFSITVEGKTITSRAVVTDAGNYASANINEWIEKKKNLKKDDQESDSITDEETESESNKYEEKYKEKTMVNETYLYLEFKKASFELEFCRTCLKKGHNFKKCVLRRNQKKETVYLNKEEKEKNFNIDNYQESKKPR
ncbi:hypothetical protein C2G38_2185467 [Gigaspora rosea]|uniref:Uncharacterized protein n=1 Tax=Gigaspora rosea TaxID=44941 RepID=A0A397V6N8_9GLOM|nr:hypothetical protein C2G38_2185467 [Gigaspora rosea]